ncbi:hypothetical protein CIB48_g8046 [Xylaria polymorpha]|nr:hypothetical protein CIB48_g8046 [Xylaria polymorpha]
MSQSTSFGLRQAIQALLARVSADHKQHELADTISQAFHRITLQCSILELDGKFLTHQAVAYGICTVLWTDIFEDYPPWRIEFADNEIVDADGDLSTAMERSVVALIHAFASHYPKEALQLLEHNDFRKIRASILDTLPFVNPSNIRMEEGKPPKPDRDRGIDCDVKALFLLWGIVVVILLAVFVQIVC